MKYFLIGLISLIFASCGVGVKNDYEVGGEASIKAEVITRFPDSQRCFDALEKNLLDQDGFLSCLEKLTNGSFTINIEGEITEVIDELTDKAKEDGNDITDKAKELEGEFNG